MNRIKILSEHVASQIAAGEVVQRPASVIKELIDNSLDAGAGRISVEVEKGGTSRMRVSDDGCGISLEDLPMALRRHATSKIEAASDLMSIQTFGFRGEALAAISSVAHVEVVSRLPSDRQGHRLFAVGGEVQALEPAGAPPGTTVTVSELFFNTPARRKFLKSVTTEMERINEIILRTAISWPSLHLDLAHNGKKARVLPPVPACIDRLVQLFGQELAPELLPVDFGTENLQITGFTSRATLHRNTASDLYFFVNRRFVRDRLLLRGLMEAYKASLPQRRYPVSVLFIEMDPEQVDVNVHPSKEEIRFRDERMVWSGLYSAIREAFDSGGSKIWIDAPHPVKWDSPQQDALPESFAPPASEPGLALPPVDIPFGSTALASPQFEPISEQKVSQSVPSMAPEADLIEEAPTIADLNRGPLVSLPKVEKTSLMEGLAVRHWRPVAQVFDSFIIAESGDEMAIFDQHALHERLQFERLRHEYEHHSISRQRLIFPMTVEIHPSRVVLLQDSLALLDEVGMEMESFGEDTFVVRSVPADMKLSEVKGFVDDALQDFAEQGMVVPLPDRAEKVLARIACRSAIKAGDPLTYDQMANLVDRYSDDPTLATCPHGRPPIWRISRRELEKWFGRP
jgi:DNA mismatch repair protein MutL